jgi:ABC-type nitrate/sulfonate/bicarbonate transport system ATPase subunit
MTTIQVDGITFRYPGASAPLFLDFDWQMAQGETCAILGSSGCGKTSLLLLLAGLRNPEKGTITIFGEPVERPRPNSGLVLQDYGLLPWATVRENVALGLNIRGFYGPDGKHSPRDAVIRNESYQRVDLWIERLGLQDHANKYPGQLSGGQRQRTAIARTLVLEPDLLLMDEPFSSLDAPTRENLQQQTLSLCKEWGITLIVVTHSIDEALVLGQQILVLTQPPNTSSHIVNNPIFGTVALRTADQAMEMIRSVREIMGMT